jgi:hypothetical protein
MQSLATGWNAHCSEVELTTMPAPCTQWTPKWSNAMPSLPSLPSLPSCNVRGEAELNAFPDRNCTWPATGVGALPTLNVESWNTLCGEVELSAMPDMNYLWPFEGGRPTPTSNDNWSALCGEVEISTIQSANIPWMEGPGVEGLLDQLNQGQVSSIQISSRK